MRNIKKYIFAAVAVLAFDVNVGAQNTAERPYAMEFSGILRNPAASATGFAGTASASTMAWSSFDNPAVMSFYDGTLDAQLLYQNWQPAYGKSTNLGAGVAYRTQKGFGVSLGFLRQQGQPYDITDEFGASKTSFTPNEMQFNLGLGFKVADFVSVGLNLKALSEQFGPNSKAMAFGGDLFAMAKLTDFSVALGVANIGTPVKSSSGQSFNLPSSVRLGGAYSRTFAEAHNIEAALDLDYFFAGGLSAAAGLQYGWNDMIFARAGYHFGTSKALLPSFASVGIGAKVYGVRLDFAYLLGNSILKNTFSVGLGYTF